MENILKSLLIIVILFMTVFLYAGEGFNIEKIHVTIQVMENGVLDINESILANFYQNKHGIFRNIPIEGVSTIKINGKDIAYVWKLAISNVTANQELKTWTTNNMYYLRMGSPDKTVQGMVEYNYNYSVYGAFITENKEYDELYWNVIGTEWAVNMKQAEFEIIFPEDIDIDKNVGYKIYYGPKGSKTTAQWTVDANLNKAVYVHPVKLNPFEGITVDIRLNKGSINIYK